MIKVGVTGQIGSGKTTAARMLEELGAYRIDADEIGRQVVNRHAALRKKLSKAFGADIIASDGTVDRQLIAQRAFDTWYTKKLLDDLVHPYLLKDLRAVIKRESRKHDVIVVDAALIFDWGLEKDLDIVITIHATRAERVKRLKARGMDERDILARQRRQLKSHVYIGGADIVVQNRGTEADLRRRIDWIWRHRIKRNR